MSEFKPTRSVATFTRWHAAVGRYPLFLLFVVLLSSCVNLDGLQFGSESLVVRTGGDSAVQPFTVTVSNDIGEVVYAVSDKGGGAPREIGGADLTAGAYDVTVTEPECDAARCQGAVRFRCHAAFELTDQGDQATVVVDAVEAEACRVRADVGAPA